MVLAEWCGKRKGHPPDMTENAHTPFPSPYPLEASNLRDSANHESVAWVQQTFADTAKSQVCGKINRHLIHTEGIDT